MDRRWSPDTKQQAVLEDIVTFHKFFVALVTIDAKYLITVERRLHQVDFLYIYSAYQAVVTLS